MPLSSCSQRVPLTTIARAKKKIYQNTFRTHEYFYYAPLKTKTTEYQEFAGFRLVAGKYQPIEPDERGWLWSEVFGMYLGVCRRDLPLSRYREAIAYWEMLRFFTIDAEVVLHPVERANLAEAERDRERLERTQAEAERDRERLERTQVEAERDREVLRANRTETQLLQAARNLLATGMAIEQVAALLELSIEQVAQLSGD
ncbi:MAG: hypothetical protein HC925_05230 [Coleofasciculaceae cyanobacterium SM2_3_26]|nr:hypothetical protein [Coleofasciculaceae cyanobacterium SM2_3_26]